MEDKNPQTECQTVHEIVFHFHTTDILFNGLLQVILELNVP